MTRKKTPKPEIKMKAKIVLIIAIFSFFSVKASVVAVADSAYRHGEYQEAAALYQQTLVEEGVSPGVLYNLGNAYFNLGKDGEAMVCYERARKLDPSNEMINGNLQFLRDRVSEANKGELKGKAVNLEPDSETFLDSLYRMIAIDSRSNGWAVFAVMAFILFLGGLAMYIFTPNVLARKTGFFSALTFFIFTTVFIVFAYLAAGHFKSQQEAVLVGFTAALLEQPEAGAKEGTAPLHKGTKFKILETRKGKDGTEWIKVRLNSENEGWLNKQEIEII